MTETSCQVVMWAQRNSTSSNTAEDIQGIDDEDECDRTSTFTPRASKAFERSTKCAVINSSGANQSWYGSLWDVLSSTLHECKVGVSYLYPRVHFSMMCRAVLQETGSEDGDSFGLAVICYRTDKKGGEKSGSETSSSAFVGGTFKPKMVRPGRIVIKLVSKDFEADTLHGEDSALSKEEDDFRGREFEKQFACKFKGQPVKEGVFGKVLVQRLAEGQHPETVFEFNLAKGRNGVARRTPPPLVAPLVKQCNAADTTADRWSMLAVKELAAMLHLTEEDNWKIFARHLGFTEHEIRTRFLGAADPFHQMITAYQARGGSPEEFVQALYEVGRRLNIEGYQYQEGSMTYARQSLMLGWTQEEDEDTVFDLNNNQLGGRPTLPGGPCSVCLTPPHTPRKRKRTTSDSSSCSPLRKTARKLSFGEDSSGSGTTASSSPTFLFPDLDDDAEDEARMTCRQELPSSALWLVSAHVHTRWKSLGRTLDVPEMELMCIEHAHRDLRECAYQALLKWQDMYPQRGLYGVLYSALCSCGLKSVAQKFCTFIE